MGAVTGAIKEAIGRLVSDPQMIDEGHAERSGHPHHPPTVGERVDQRLEEHHVMDESRRSHGRRFVRQNERAPEGRLTRDVVIDGPTGRTVLHEERRIHMDAERSPLDDRPL